MSATAEGHSPLDHPELGDLNTWYRTLEECAASATPGNPYFHGPHVAAPVDLARVEEGLRWFAAQYPAAQLPTLKQIRAAMLPGRESPHDSEPLDEGSPMHNFWHWLHGN